MNDAPPDHPSPPEHPSAYALEAAAAAAGGADEAVARHLDACDACRAHVMDLRAAAARFVAARPARPFVAALPDAARGVGDGRGGRVLRLVARRAAWALPLAAAAAALLFVSRPGARFGPDAPGDVPTEARPSGPTRFKGTDVALAVVRERSGRQERLTTSFGVREGDALRLEVTLAARAPVAAGVLEDDGTWTPLLVPTELEPGPRFVDDALRVDARPGGGTFVAGAPEAVDAARRTRRFDDVVTLRFEPEPR